MAERLSRRKLAAYAAEELLAGRANVFDELAALLVAERREREQELLVRDIEDELSSRGVVVATVESAQQLDEGAKMAIREMIGRSRKAKPKIYLREIIKPELIGGVRILTPTQVLDGTIAKKLSDLREQKI